MHSERFPTSENVLEGRVLARRRKQHARRVRAQERSRPSPRFAWFSSAASLRYSRRRRPHLLRWIRLGAGCSCCREIIERIAHLAPDDALGIDVDHRRQNLRDRKDSRLRGGLLPRGVACACANTGPRRRREPSKSPRTSRDLPGSACASHAVSRLASELFLSTRLAPWKDAREARKPARDACAPRTLPPYRRPIRNFPLLSCSRPNLCRRTSERV